MRWKESKRNKKNKRMKKKTDGNKASKQEVMERNVKSVMVKNNR